MRYKTKAKKLIKAGFWVAGYGHFDITIEELAIVLELIEKEDFKNLEAFYNELSETKL